MLGSALRVLWFSQDVPIVPVPTPRSLQPDYRPIHNPQPCVPRFQPCPEWYSIATRSWHVPPSIQHNLVIPNRARLPLVTRTVPAVLPSFWRRPPVPDRPPTTDQVPTPLAIAPALDCCDFRSRPVDFTSRDPDHASDDSDAPTSTTAILIAPQAKASLPSDSTFVKTAQLNTILSTIIQIVTAAPISKPDVVPTDSSCSASPEVPRPMSAPSAQIESTPAPAVVLAVSSPLHSRPLEEEIRRICASGHKTEYPQYIMPMIQAQPTILTPAMPPISNRPPSTIDVQPSASSLASIPHQPIPWKPIAIANKPSPTSHAPAALVPIIAVKTLSAPAPVPLSLPSRSCFRSPIVVLETSPIVLFTPSSPIELLPKITPAPVIPAVITSSG